MRRMTWWQFSETIEGFVRSKTSDKEEGLSANEEEQMSALLNAPL
jgi:hypothetical protein